MDYKPYRPEDPRVGDIIIKTDNWNFDISNPDEIARRSAVITERIAPNHRGGIHNYRIHVHMAENGIVQTESQDWKCLRQLLAFSHKFVERQETLVKKLETMIPKKPGPDMDMS